jgi:hypothetical protein
MNSFFSPHIILGVDKHHDLRNKKCQTVGDALSGLLAVFLIGKWPGSGSEKKIVLTFRYTVFSKACALGLS